MKWGWLKKQPVQKGQRFDSEVNSKKHKATVESAANYALSKYDKTFVDLAKYDKGEKIFDAVSQ